MGALAGAVIVLSLGLICALLFRLHGKRRSLAAKGLPPVVTSWSPLGCALQYQADPKGFLQIQKAKHQGVFTLDMAGLLMVILADAQAISQYSRAKDTVLNSTEAIRDFGFYESLGDHSASSGARFTTALLAKIVAGKLDMWREKIEQIVNQEVHVVLSAKWTYTSTGATALLPLVRLVLIRSVIRAFFGSDFMKALPSTFCEEYFAWQDDQEEAVAKAMALPKWLAQPLFIRPVAQRRLRLESQMLQAFRAARNSPDGLTPYLTELHALCQQEQPLPDFQPAVSLHPLLGQHLISLLFTAHKNPSIAATHTLAMLVGNRDMRNRVMKEKMDKDSHPNQAMTTPYLDHCMHESLRMTAHAIGSLRVVSCNEGFTFTSSAGKTYTLPKGQLVATSMCAMSYDPKTYADPNSFEPDRFQRGEHQQRGAAFLPFSDGVHRCPGRFIALSLIENLVSAWLTTVDTEMANDPELSFKKATLAQTNAYVRIRLNYIDG